MGANISITARVSSFCRELDLISIGPHAAVSGVCMGRLVDARGVRFEKVQVPQYSKLPAEEALYPGRVPDLQERESDPCFLLPVRLFYPLFFLAAYLSASYFLSFAGSKMGIDERAPRLVLCFFGSVLVGLLSSLITRLRLSKWVGDRLFSHAAGMLDPFLRFNTLGVVCSSNSFILCSQLLQ